MYRTDPKKLYQEEWITLIVAAFYLLGHIILGFFYLKNKNRKEEEDCLKCKLNEYNVQGQEDNWLNFSEKNFSNKND